MAERKPQFVGNAVLPDFVMGLPLNPAKQGLGPCGTVMKTIWDGGEIWKLFRSQFVVDVKDTALLHIAGLVKPDVEGERVFAFAWRKRWTDVFPMLERMYPGHTFPAPPENEGADLANVTARPRAEEMLKWFGESGWTPMEDGFKAAFDAVRDGLGPVTHITF